MWIFGLCTGSFRIVQNRGLEYRIFFGPDLFGPDLGLSWLLPIIAKLLRLDESNSSFESGVVNFGSCGSMKLAQPRRHVPPKS